MLEYLLVFESSNKVMLAKELTNNLGTRIVPMPPEITVECGLALKCPAEKIESIERLLMEHNITIKKVEKL